MNQMDPGKVPETVRMLLELRQFWCDTCDDAPEDSPLAMESGEREARLLSVLGRVTDMMLDAMEAEQAKEAAK